ncbi:MAG: NAD(P)-dependent oxidoreductase, partial [Planctomycetaceae bacterium]|nr:NAD(P)-dependent oxidoreductase [Planctomycetaceae bacterium]
KAEHEPQVAELVNAEAPAILAAEAERRNIPIIHLSTSYVFDGKDQTEPYTENDHTNPLSVYGRSKLSGEQRVRDLCDRHLIFRLSSIYGIRRRNFLTTMLKYLHQSEAPHVVDDQIVSPTWCPIIADAMESVILRLLKKSQVPWGIYHFCSSGAVSCHEFACEIFKLLSATHGIPTPVPHPVTSQEFNAKALRPAYSILNSQEFITTFAYPILSWKTQLIHCMNTLRPENMDAIIGSPHWRKMK